MKKWTLYEKLVVLVAVVKIKMLKKSIYSQVNWVQKYIDRSFESVRTRINRLRGIG